MQRSKSNLNLQPPSTPFGRQSQQPPPQQQQTYQQQGQPQYVSTSLRSDAHTLAPSRLRDVTTASSAFPLPSLLSTGLVSASSLSDSASSQDPAAKTFRHNIRKALRRYYLLCYNSLAVLMAAPQKAFGHAWAVPAAAAAAVLLILAMVTLCATGLIMHGRPGESQQHNKRYAVYIDGGSSGTRVHVFEYFLSPWPSYVQLVLPELNLAVEPGLSSYANDPPKAAQSLLPLLEFAYKHVPSHLWHITPVHLLGTAGLRLLPGHGADAILNECRKALASTQFVFNPEWVKVMDGQYEGLYAWAAANYAAGMLQSAIEAHQAHNRKDLAEPISFYGVLEMGGASLQITFLPQAQDALPESISGALLALPGVPNKLYTHSYLGLGMDASLATASEVVHMLHKGGPEPVMDPCLPTGFVAEDGRRGNATFHDCLSIAYQVLRFSSCSNSRCNIQGVTSPPLSGRFLAIENFYWTARALGLHEEASLQEIYDGGIRYCSRHWSSLHAEFSGHIPDQYLIRYCFGAAYIFTMLHHGFGMQLHERVLVFTNTIRTRQGEEVGLNWVVGAMLAEAMATEHHSTQHFMSRDRLLSVPRATVLWYLLPALLLLLLALLLVLAMVKRGWGSSLISGGGGSVMVGSGRGQGGMRLHGVASSGMVSPGGFYVPGHVNGLPPKRPSSGSFVALKIRDKL